MGSEDDEIKDILTKYKSKLENELDPERSDINPISSREYNDFKRDYVTFHHSLYEKSCNLAEKVLKIKPDPAKAKLVQENINICHLEVTPGGVLSLSILLPIVLMLVGGVIGYLIPVLFLAQPSMFFVMFFMFSGLILMVPLGKIPGFMANSWRMKASNQMVLCVFYVVTYMRHTSNLENAIDFAAEHLSPPLSLDLKKVLWDVETQKYESVKESLDYYLESWRKWNLEFIEAMHLIEGSLYESAEDRRLNALDKALSVILEETYEKMLHFAQNLKSPITMLHMLGIILPILGLVVLPLVVSFMEGVKWYHIAALYNVMLPIGVFYLGKVVLASRPTGYGDTDISEENPELRKYRNLIINLGGAELRISPLIIAILVGGLVFLFGIMPVVMFNLGMPDFGFGLKDATNSCGKQFCFLEYRESKTDPDLLIGPYGLGAAIVSLAVPLGLGLMLGLKAKLQSKNVIKIREKAKRLETEFASALFQLGNRLGDGFPAEIAFDKVADMMEGTVSGNFFRTVSTNIRKLGMGVHQAIFDTRVGALIYYPSNLIESSMKVLVESSKKGPLVASQALINVSQYIKQMHSVDERLKDLLSDIISSMKSQISFLTPVISGIVVGITSMITTILGRLSQQMRAMTESAAQSGSAALGGGGIMEMFGDGIPAYYFQVIVGIYVVQIIWILSVLTNGIENGSDKLGEKYAIGTNLIKSVVLYSVVSAIVMLIFNLIAGQIMGSIGNIA